MIECLTGLYIALFVLLARIAAMNIANALLLSISLMKFGMATISTPRPIQAIMEFSTRLSNRMGKVEHEAKTLDITGMTRD